MFCSMLCYMCLQREATSKQRSLQNVDYYIYSLTDSSACLIFAGKPYTTTIFFQPFNNNKINLTTAKYVTSFPVPDLNQLGDLQVIHGKEGQKNHLS